MDHRNVPVDSEQYPKYLEEVDKVMDGQDKLRLINTESTDTYVEGIPEDDVETTLKVLRHFRKIAVLTTNHEVDIHFGYVYQKIVLAASICNQTAIEQSLKQGDNCARADTSPTPTEQPQDTSNPPST